MLSQTYSYVYNKEDDTLSQLHVESESTDDTITYSYDYFKRLSSKSYGAFTQSYAYKMLSDTRTSTLIDEFKWNFSNGNELKYSYTYDELGNIKEIFKNGEIEYSYGYDEQGQLTAVVNVPEMWAYTYDYDTYGNIRYVVKYDIDNAWAVLEEDTYSYTDPTWLDRLTAFNGVTITYDDAGNPLSYYNGSAYTLTWQNGRELATATKGGVTSSYKYNIDGQRVQKTVGNVVYDYYYADGLLVRQTWGNNYIDFIYDESGIFSFVYNGVQYYYIKNLQSDIVAIANADGTILVEYVYDAWGDVISITGTEATTLGIVNPIRYRGYYFDTDTEFYYLNSRYYDPEIRRFINADEYASTGQGFIGYNMYAYCGNNPISRIDDSGEFWAELWNEFTQLVTQSQGVLVTAGAISQLDTPAPGPADVAAGIIAGATILACLGMATYYTVSEAVTSVSIPQVTVSEQNLTNIAKQYDMYQCKEAAEAMKKANRKGKIIRLYFPYDDFVCCDRYLDAISENGTHYGYLYNEIVYCNIYPEGKPKMEWISSFYVASGTPPQVNCF